MLKPKSIALILGVLAMSLLAGYLVLAWTDPTAVPPGGNIASPINIGSVQQWKEGGLGIGTKTFDLASGQTAASIFYDKDNSSWYVNPAGTSIFSTSIGIGVTVPTYKLDVVSGGATTARFGTVSTDKVVIGGGAGKLDVGTVDPIFEIDGKKYATYMADFVGGTRSETSGILKLENVSPNQSNQYQPAVVINFDNLEVGSNLWLFWQTSNKNIKDVAVLLTPGFQGEVWYEKSENTIIIYGNGVGEVSYRLSAPRVDYQNWGNIVGDQSLMGIKVIDY
jgi:hypothetical protein